MPCKPLSCVDGRARGPLTTPMGRGVPRSPWPRVGPCAPVLGCGGRGYRADQGPCGALAPIRSSPAARASDRRGAPRRRPGGPDRPEDQVRSTAGYRARQPDPRRPRVLARRARQGAPPRRRRLRRITTSCSAGPTAVRTTQRRSRSRSTARSASLRSPTSRSSDCTGTRPSSWTHSQTASDRRPFRVRFTRRTSRYGVVAA